MLSKAVSSTIFKPLVLLDLGLNLCLPDHWRSLYSVDHWLSGRVFANGPGDRDSISGRFIPKTKKRVLDTSWFNTRQYKVRIKGKVQQCRERCSAPPPLHLSVVAIENCAFGLPSTTVTNFTLKLCN